MTAAPRLDCTHAQFEGLHAALSKARTTSTTVRVDRAALVALLLDHGRLIRACKDARLTLEGEI